MVRRDGGPVTHQPIRPHWRCRGCGAPYPCGAARLALLAEYRGDRVALAIYLAVVMHDAMDDIWRVGHRPDVARLHERFLGWLSRTPTTGPGG
jgi:hypothetical protein